MLKIRRPAMPEILKIHQQEWTNHLVGLVKQYGGYNNIPEAMKNQAVNKYQHEEIKEIVRKLFHGKCVFCEEMIETVTYAHIEHFYPKSIYYEKTFEWENLFPACHKCNIAKGDFDTQKYPIVNPEIDTPEHYFIYRDIRIQPAPDSPDREKSQRTIEVCDLHRLSLFRPMAKILLQFYENEQILTEKLSEYQKLTRKADKLKRLHQIHSALEHLKD